MPNWKKVLISGSNASLNSLIIDSGSLSVAGDITGSFISASIIDLADTTEPPHSPGRLFYSADVGAFCYYNAEPDIALEIGQEFWLRAQNTTGATISDGTPVFVSGSQGDKPLIHPAAATPYTSSNSALNRIIGLATHDIENNTEGYVTTQGAVRGIDTSQYAEGAILFVSSSSGELTDIAPSPPYDELRVGIVVRSHSNGIIYVDPICGFSTSKLSDFSQSKTPTDGEIWVYDQSRFTWTNSKENINISGSFSGSFQGDGSGLTGIGGGDNYTFNAYYRDQNKGQGSTFGTLTGLADGVNSIFTVSQGTYTTETLKVIVNGQVQGQGTDQDWFELSPSNGTFAFNSGSEPRSGSLVSVEYATTGNSTGSFLVNVVEDLTPQLGGDLEAQENSIIFTGSFSGDHSSSGNEGYFTAGASLTFGNFCYLNSSARMVNANASISGSTPCIGMAVDSISNNSSGKFLLSGFARDDSWNWSSGDVLYLSTTAGTIQNYAPTGSNEVVQVIGVAINSDTIYFKPELDRLIHA